jgi:SpoVK/Ycf46/Vps4 family AAA+-type ATPase
VQNILNQIKRESKSQSLILTATRLAKRGGFPMDEIDDDDNNSSSNTELGRTDSTERRQGVEARKGWEDFRDNVAEVGELVGRSRIGDALVGPKGGAPRSALTSRETSNGGKRDLFLAEIETRLMEEKIDRESPIQPEAQEPILPKAQQPIQSKAQQPIIKAEIAEKFMDPEADVDPTPKSKRGYRMMGKDALLDAQLRTSELVAKSGSNFEGEMMGIGGLDDVLAQVKRRIWIPLAAPPVLLQELGISPVRGLLLYGKPGCGKTLIARTIGQILSPSRPVTVVSGPELMDKFVGSSEQNVRRIFDDPPPIFDHVKVHEVDDGKALSQVALHVVILDEFDAMARARGGKSGDGNQGEAGVARDSVVNQILAKMDGVDPLPVPTLVIGMTNKRSLIDPALLRPGRFEVSLLAA